MLGISLTQGVTDEPGQPLRRDAGYETIMLNCNPETVSTDYDTSSRLYFEPLTVEDVLNVIEARASLCSDPDASPLYGLCPATRTSQGRAVEPTLSSDGSSLALNYQRNKLMHCKLMLNGMALIKLPALR